MAVNLVAPITGAWIETGFIRPSHLHFHVAPITGAWIETLSPSGSWPKYPCRAHHGRVD